MATFSLILLSSPGLFCGFVKISDRFSIERISLGIVSSFTLLIFVGYWLGIFGLSARIPFICISLVALVSVFFLMLRKKEVKQFKGFLILSMGTFLACWSLFPWIVKMSSQRTGLGMFTSANADSISYVAASNEFLKSGFSESHHIFPGGVNHFVHFSTPISPTILMSWISSTFTITSWEAVMPTIVVATGFAGFGLLKLMKTIFPKISTILSALISALIMCSSIMFYIIENYFLGQIFAIGVSALLLSNTIRLATKIDIYKSLYIETTLLLVLCFFSYPTFLLPFIMLSFLIGGCLSFRISLQFFKHYIIVFLMCCFTASVLSMPYFFDAIRILTFSNSVKAGYPIAPMNPFNMVLFIDEIGLSTPLKSLIFGWCFLLGCLLFPAIRQRNKSTLDFARFLILAISLFLASAFPLLRGQEYSEYQSWKFQTYLFPMVLAMTLPFLWEKLAKVKSSILYFYMIATLAIMPLSHISISKPSQIYPTKDMIYVAADSRLDKLKTLNVGLTPVMNQC